jgi:hypothetical protein
MFIIVFSAVTLMSRGRLWNPCLYSKVKASGIVQFFNFFKQHTCAYPRKVNPSR